MDGIDKAIPQGADGNLDKAQIDWLRMMPDGWNGDEWESYQNSVPATEENMAKFGWVRERTCRIESSYYYDDYDLYEFEFSCGHSVNMYDKEPTSYCPICGCKVVGE